VRLRGRVFRAAVQLIANAIVWILVPIVISSFIARSMPNIPLANPAFIYAFGATITGLQVLGALTEGTAVSVVFVSGGDLASAFYIWEALEGGALSITTAGITATVGFRTLLFLFMLPSLFGAVKAPLMFLLEHSEAARPAPELP